MMGMILVTGSEGLIGASVCSALAAGVEVRRFDIRRNARLDVRDINEVATATADCTGIVHLAAVSRVIWGERDPQACWTTNVDGTRNVLRAARRSPRRPWVIVASSREAYGQPALLPADEDTLLAPLNAYGRSKVAAERLCAAAQAAGVHVAIARFSNVYGSVEDHADRVVPRFVRSALDGKALHLEGADNTFDFTHVNDTVEGVVAMMRALGVGETLPPIQFVTGRPTTLTRLAELAVETTGSSSTRLEAPSRTYDVARFWGSPSRARCLLGWKPRTTIEDGISQLVRDMQRTTVDR